MKDYAVIYFGSAIFKISRLLFIAMMCVHVFACGFYKIKKESEENEGDADLFYESKNVDPKVSLFVA